MIPHLAEIWRHPIKSHGRESLTHVLLSEGKALPWDRRWAVAHERSCFDHERPSWQPCNEFKRVASSPSLQAITVRCDMGYQRITLSHPKRPDLTIDPDNHDDELAFIQWVMPISHGGRLLPARLVRAPGVAMTDTGYASVSLINMNSHREVAVHLGQKLSPQRWRGNLILENLPAFAERDWIGKRLRIGLAELEIREPITRCAATTASTRTGERDADTLGALKALVGAAQMGVYAVVVKTGDLRTGDAVEVLE
ncbi:MOSC domain-containing protein [Sinisalibacter aestuarii]|uniref:Molybdenum cofactor biosynthesis protein n=1 Tax=Sinisalibacter aestuarii TaxID=2949426 RepID=A0ABQ5LXQ9_9RHOB|nr:MOSC domain-containing protein [Sinisalibacter aestuarii]GKY89181.1 molybdenum cofactor biosynthesis protein [Sinisalibacter aestuarii]